MAWYSYTHPHTAKVFSELCREANIKRTRLNDRVPPDTGYENNFSILGEYSFTGLGTSPSDSALLTLDLSGTNPASFIRNLFSELMEAIGMNWESQEDIYWDCWEAELWYGTTYTFPGLPSDLIPADWDEWISHVRNAINAFDMEVVGVWQLPDRVAASTEMTLGATPTEDYSYDGYGGPSPLFSSCDPVEGITYKDIPFSTVGSYPGSEGVPKCSSSWGYVHPSVVHGIGGSAWPDVRHVWDWGDYEPCFDAVYGDGWFYAPYPFTSRYEYGWYKGSGTTTPVTLSQTTRTWEEDRLLLLHNSAEYYNTTLFGAILMNQGGGGPNGIAALAGSMSLGPTIVVGALTRAGVGDNPKIGTEVAITPVGSQEYTGNVVITMATPSDVLAGAYSDVDRVGFVTPIGTVTDGGVYSGPNCHYNRTSCPANGTEIT